MNYLLLKQRLLFYNALIGQGINYASVLWTNCDKDPGGHLGIFWVGMCRLGLEIGTPF